VLCFHPHTWPDVLSQYEGLWVWLPWPAWASTHVLQLRPPGRMPPLSSQPWPSLGRHSVQVSHRSLFGSPSPSLPAPTQARVALGLLVLLGTLLLLLKMVVMYTTCTRVVCACQLSLGMKPLLVTCRRLIRKQRTSAFLSC
jgi:hypothetical protein